MTVGQKNNIHIFTKTQRFFRVFALLCFIKKICALNLRNLREKSLFLLFLLLNFTVVAQQDTIRYSKETAVEVRVPSQKKIDKFNNDKNFQYEEETFSPSLFERIFWWILEKIFGKLKYSEVQTITSNFWDYFVIPLAIIILILVILKFLGVNYSGIFGRKQKSVDLNYLIDDEDVNSSRFDELFAKALQDKNYRLALRYLYLKSLQKLNDNELITWHPNKTNHSYIDELAVNKGLQNSFREKVYLFELIWYGEYQITESEFSQIHKIFTAFNQRIESQFSDKS